MSPMFVQASTHLVDRAIVDKWLKVGKVGTFPCHVRASTAYLSSEFPLERSNPFMLATVIPHGEIHSSCWQSRLPRRKNDEMDPDRTH